MIKISDLKLNKINPRAIKDKRFEALCKSIKEFPKMMRLRPIVIDKSAGNVALGGNMRLRALIKLGYTEIEDNWVIDCGDLTDKEKKRFIVVDNVGFGEWDMDLLTGNYETEELQEYGMETEFISEEYESDERDNEVPDVDNNKPTICKLGDIWQLGRHRLMCGDSMKIEDVERLMDGKKANMMFTSPPYNMAGKMYKNYKDNLESKEYIEFNKIIFENFSLHTNGLIFWNISYNKNSKTEFIEIIYKIIKEIDGIVFLDLVVWDKGHGLPVTSKDAMTRQYEDIFVFSNEEDVFKDNELITVFKNNTKAYFRKKKGKGLSNYWKVETNNTQIKGHQACYPVELVVKGIVIGSDKGDIVIDPFGGSGTNFISCEKTERICYGMELDEYYCDVIIKRWEKYSGNKAQKIN